MAQSAGFGIGRIGREPHFVGRKALLRHLMSTADFLVPSNTYCNQVLLQDLQFWPLAVINGIKTPTNKVRGCKIFGLIFDVLKFCRGGLRRCCSCCRGREDASAGWRTVPDHWGTNIQQHPGNHGNFQVKTTVDGRNSAPVDRYPFICRVL